MQVAASRFLLLSVHMLRSPLFWLDIRNELCILRCLRAASCGATSHRVALFILRCVSRFCRWAQLLVFGICEVISTDSVGQTLTWSPECYLYALCVLCFSRCSLAVVCDSGRAVVQPCVRGRDLLRTACTSLPLHVLTCSSCTSLANSRRLASRSPAISNTIQPTGSVRSAVATRCQNVHSRAACVSSSSMRDRRLATSFAFYIFGFIHPTSLLH